MQPPRPRWRPLRRLLRTLSPNKLPKRPENQEYALVDDDILLIDKKTKIIIDILKDAGSR